MNVNKCSCNGCALDVWKEYDKCVLHCPKGTYSEGFNDGTLSKFYDEFKKYIIDSVKKSHRYNDDFQAKILTEDLENNDRDIKALDTWNEYKEYQIVPRNIIFPTRDDRDSFDYLQLLNLFGRVWFIDCKFYESYLELLEVKVFFKIVYFQMIGIYMIIIYWEIKIM